MNKDKLVEVPTTPEVEKWEIDFNKLMETCICGDDDAKEIKEFISNLISEAEARGAERAVKAIQSFKNTMAQDRCSEHCKTYQEEIQKLSAIATPTQEREEK